VEVRVVPRFDPAAYAGRGAVGLMVPGLGGTVTRAGTLAALERGKVKHALLGGTPTGRVLVVPARSPGTRVTLYVALPPPGRSSNHIRYPVAVVGCGFRGLLTSTATRIPGLVSVADIAHAVVRLRAGGCRASPLGWTASPDAPGRLRSLDHRLVRVAAARGWILVVMLIAGGFLALVRGTAGVVFCAAAVAASIVFGALGVESHAALVFGVPAAAVAAAFLVPRRLVPLAVTCFFVGLLLVLVLDTQVNSLAVLGDRPDGGGRFYGVSNQMETLLVAPAIAAVAAGAPWSAVLGVIALVTVAWSRAGADGGGLVVYAVAFAVLALRTRGRPVSVRRAAAAVVAVVAVVGLVIALDAALGGSSHVTHAVGGGPGTLAGDLWRRLHLSYLTVTSTSGKLAEFLVPVAVLVVIAAFMRIGPTVDAMLVAIVASFLVNDSPVDVAFLGALGSWTLVCWESVDSRAMRRPLALLAPLGVVLGLVGAGCGSEGTTRALPNTVVGTVNTSVSGKQVFSSQGCTACHTYKPAGSTGTIGPNLDKLPQYAKQAKQPLAAFVQQSIVDPNAYIQKGYPPGVMPQTYKTLPADQLKALVDFLTTKS
jgi:cytochrome c551/c552